MEEIEARSLVKRIRSATLEGATAHEVAMEASFTRGLPGFSIVGLGDEAIKEARERVKSALLLSGFQFPPLKITINLSPGDLKKSGSQMDLPMALLIAMQKEPVTFGEFFCFGELGLEGTVRATPSVFALALSLARQGKLKKVVCDPLSAAELSRIPDVEAYAVATLAEAIAFFKGERREPLENLPLTARQIVVDQPYYYEARQGADFKEVRGQSLAKRAAVIAAAGFHNLTLSGAPGCGKSMIIKRLRDILPPMSLAELLERASLDSLEGRRPSFEALRPIRSPHHTSTRASIFGGGSAKEARMGEVALANGGILFFDELPHFPKAVLEALREPLEDHRLLISRVNTKTLYETRFLFAAAMNPCPCGNLYSQSRECRCTPPEIARYQNRLSEPFWDRIDLFVQMADSDISQKADVDSAGLREQVFGAFTAQKKRGQTRLNGKLDDAQTDRFCVLDDDAQAVLIQAAGRFGLSQRAAGKIRRVARTIADLDGAEIISKPHLFEALSFRRR